MQGAHKLAGAGSEDGRKIGGAIVRTKDPDGAVSRFFGPIKKRELVGAAVFSNGLD